MQMIKLNGIAAVILFFVMAINSVYAHSQDDKSEAYIMALRTVSPVTAKYTILYKEAVEARCNTSLTVQQLNSTEFINVIQMLVFSDTVKVVGIEKADTLLNDTLVLVEKNINCVDLNAPFAAALNDSEFIEKHQHLSKVLQTWNHVVSSEIHN